MAIYNYANGDAYRSVAGLLARDSVNIVSYTPARLCTHCLQLSLVPRPHPLPYHLQYKEREGLGELMT